VTGAAIPAATVALTPELASCTAARHLVVDFVAANGLDHVGDSAAMCATELATNAVLHAREPFVFTVRTAGTGLRIDVLDTCPQHLPITTPRVGSAVDLTGLGTGGRGMLIVASLAHRWGIFTTREAKTVWVEVRDEPTPDPPLPFVTVVEAQPVAGNTVALHFVDMPVRAAVASGIQTEEVIREIQLDQGLGTGRDPSEVASFFSLVDRSASVRLPGRHAALRAAALGRDRFDLVLETSPDALAALPLLAQVLARFEADRQAPFPVLTDEVITFRGWLQAETERQRAGLMPRACPLPMDPSGAASPG
jgi:anti-sigma regulatory factor (Ser/Thr protein kinase)